MSMELHVLVADARLPNVKEWQETIDAFGYDLKLDPNRVVRENKGFFSCTFEGQKSGFEFDIFPASAIVQAYREFLKPFTDRETSANFRWSGDFVEVACILIASAALAKFCNGIWFDPQAGSCLTADEAIQQMRLEVGRELLSFGTTNDEILVGDEDLGRDDLLAAFAYHT